MAAPDRARPRRTPGRRAGVTAAGARAPRHRRGAGEQEGRGLPPPDPGRAGRRRSASGPAPSSRSRSSRGESRLARRAFWIHRVRPDRRLRRHASSSSSSRPAPAPAGWPRCRRARRLDGHRPAGPAVRAAQGAGRLRAGRRGLRRAPLFPLAERLRERGCAVHHARRRRPTRRTCSRALEARRPPAAVTVVTGDGSVGPTRRRRRRARRGAGPRRRRGRLRRRAARRPARASPRPPRRTAPGARPRVERPLTCATGLCQGCAVPVVGEDGVAAHGPRLRRGPGVPRRPGALGDLDTCPSSAGRRGERLVIDVAGLALPAPVMVAAGCGGTGRELAAYADLGDLGAFVTRSITLDARAGGPLPRIVGDPVRPGQRGRPAEPRPRALPATELPWLASRAPASSSRSPAARWGSTPSWPAASAAPRASPAIEVQPVGARRREPGSSTCASRSTPPASCRRPARPAARPAGAGQARARTWSASSRPPAPSSTPAPTPSWSATRCPAAMPDGRPARPQRPGDPPDRAALRRRGVRRPARRAGRSVPAASPTPTTPARSSPPAPPPSRSAPPCCTTRTDRRAASIADLATSTSPHRSQEQPMTFGARLHARHRRARAALRRHRPARRRCSHDVGPRPTTSPGWRGSR